MVPEIQQRQDQMPLLAPQSDNSMPGGGEGVRQNDRSSTASADPAMTAKEKIEAAFEDNIQARRMINETFTNRPDMTVSSLLRYHAAYVTFVTAALLFYDMKGGAISVYLPLCLLGAFMVQEAFEMPKVIAVVLFLVLAALFPMIPYAMFGEYGWNILFYSSLAIYSNFAQGHYQDVKNAWRFYRRGKFSRLVDEARTEVIHRNVSAGARSNNFDDTNYCDRTHRLSEPPKSGQYVDTRNNPINPPLLFDKVPDPALQAIGTDSFQASANDNTSNGLFSTRILIGMTQDKKAVVESLISESGDAYFLLVSPEDWRQILFRGKFTTDSRFVGHAVIFFADQDDCKVVDHFQMTPLCQTEMGGHLGRHVGIVCDYCRTKNFQGRRYCVPSQSMDLCSVCMDKYDEIYFTTASTHQKQVPSKEQFELITTPAQNPYNHLLDDKVGTGTQNNTNDVKRNQGTSLDRKLV